MMFPKLKKRLKRLLSSIELVSRRPKRIALTAGIITLAVQSPTVARPVITTETKTAIDRRQISKYSTKHLLRSAARSVGHLFAQHRSHSSHASHSSHSSHYSSSNPSPSYPAPSYPTPTPYHYSSSGTTPTPRTVPNSPTLNPPVNHPTTSSSKVVLFDYFNDELVSTKKWRRGSLTGGSRYTDSEIAVSVRDGKLTITPRTGVATRSYNGWITSSSWDMTAAHARVEVSQATSGTADTIFAFGLDNDNWYGFVVEGEKLYMQVKIDGQKNSTTLPYSASLHRYWRLRHEAALNQILWETSADGETWSIARRATIGFPLTECYIYLGAGTFVSETNPGKAVFDSFRLVVHSDQ